MHVNLARFFEDFTIQDKEINLVLVGDSMTGDNTGNLGQMGSGILGSWEWAQRSDGSSGLIGQGSMCPGSGSGLTNQMSGVIMTAGGGTWSQQNADVVTSVGLQPCARNVWSIAATRTLTTIYNGYARDMQQLGSTTNALMPQKIGYADLYNNQYCQSKLVWRKHAAGPPAANLEVCAQRRASNISFSTAGSDVGVGTSIDMSGSGIGSVTVNCGNGAGEPGYRLTSLVTNAGSETAYLLGQSFYRRSGAGYANYPGVFFATIGTGGYNIYDTLRAFGATTMTGADGATDAITPFITAADAQSIISGMMPTSSTFAGPTHWIIRLGQNLLVSNTPDAQHNENTFCDAGNPACMYYHYLDLINRCREISFNLNGVYPKILLISPINVKETSSVTNRNTRAVAAQMAASVYNDSLFDAWNETYPSLAYGNVLYPWYTRGAIDSSSTDGVHENPIGARINARQVFEAGMRSLGLDAGYNFSGSARPNLTSPFRNRYWR